MKRILTLVCLCLSFSIMSAKGFSTIDSKDVIKQKTEFVKAQDVFSVDQTVIVSQEVEKNFKAVSDAVSSKAVMDVRQNIYITIKTKHFLLPEARSLQPDLNSIQDNLSNCKYIKNNLFIQTIYLFYHPLHLQ